MQHIYTGAIDPTTAWFLPAVVLSQATPLEPLAIDDYQWGDLAALSATLPAELCTAIGGGGAHPKATMSLSQMRVVGLSNVLPDPPTVTGETVTWRLGFGKVAALPAGVTVPPQLLIQGTFTIALTDCDKSAPSQLTGTFTVAFTGAEATASLNVQARTIQDPDGATYVQYTATAAAVEFTASQALFAFQTIDYGGPVNPLLRDAFNKYAGTRVQALIEAKLSEKATLAALGGVLTDAFNSMGNQTVLDFALALLYGMAVKSTGEYYLPNEIKQATNPVLEPFAAGGWPMTDIGQWYTDAGPTLCGDIGSESGITEIQTPGTLVPVELSDIEVGGTSNLMPLPMLLVGDTVWGMVVCNAVTGWPVRLTVSGNFKLTVTCCATDDGAACSGASNVNTGTGTFRATITHATVSVQVALSTTGVKPDEKLVATAERIYFRCDPNTSTQQNIGIDVAITSVPPGERKAWSDVANTVFNSPQATNAIVDQIRTRLNQDAVRAKLSDIATTAIRSVLGAEETKRAISEIKTRQRRPA